MQLHLLLTVLCSLLLQVCAIDTTNHKVTVYAWPLSAKSPSPLAQISYAEAGHIESYTPPKAATADEVIRVGLYDKRTKHWTGVATSATSFEPGRVQKITLHVDAKKEVYHVGFSTSKVLDGTQGDATVEVIEQLEGRQPVLNRPVVVTEDGRVEQKEPEKSFLQKYWWVLVVFLVMQVIAGVGGGDK